MKTLTKKILEAGLVDKHTALMLERWGQLDPESADMVGKNQVTKKTFQEFAEEIEALLIKEEENDFKETKLETLIREDPRYFDQMGSHIHGRVTFTAYEDEMGRLLVSPYLTMFVGDTISPVGSDPIGIVKKIEPLYQEDKLIALQLTVEAE